MTFAIPSRRAVFSGKRFTPEDLGSLRKAHWSAARTDLITLQAGSVVSSWKDIVATYDAVQAVNGARPLYDPVGFNGWPVVIGDGTDDELTYAPISANIPTGATACEEWYLVDQKSLVADTSTRTIGSFGGSTARSLRRLVTTGVNRAQDADSGTTLSHPSADFSGRHIVRLIATGTQVNIEIDGVAATAAAQVSATSTSRMRFFAGAGTSAAAWSFCGIAERLITLPLDTTQATNVLNYYRQFL